MTTNIALYARVSSERQAQTNTIDSQIIALKTRIKNDGYILLSDYTYIDDGYSGSTLLRPALEKLRDDASNHLFDCLYVHSPDRLARKYAYQYLLTEELQRLNITIIFLNYKIEDNPEANLLLQVQGMISEYERTKIMERSRRGKIHAAKNGHQSVLSGAPYGYRYFPKNGQGIARYEIIEDEAKAIRLLFNWIAIEKMSINGATKRLTEMGFPTAQKKQSAWNRGTVSHILKNPTYKGMAAFGKRKYVERKPRIRPNKGQAWQPKTNYSYVRVPQEKWIYIPVPKIIDEHIFDLVQLQLAENKKLKRERKTGAKYLLQTLIVCQKCGYAYSGNTATGSREYNYYTCTGTKTYANRTRKCNAASLNADKLEEAVWNEVVYFLSDTKSIDSEYKRRSKNLKLENKGTERTKLNKEKTSIENKIKLLIDSYTDSLITKAEFEPRIKTYREHVRQIEQKILQLMDDEKQHHDVQIFMDKLENFANEVNTKLNSADWETKRNILLSLVKLIEIENEYVNIVFKVNPPDASRKNNLLEHCPRSRNSTIPK